MRKRAHLPLVPYLALLGLGMIARAGTACPTDGIPQSEAQTVAAAPGAPVDSSEEDIVMRWSTPEAEPRPDMVAWHELNAPSLTAVDAAWGTLLRRLNGHRPTRFEPQCLALSSSLRQLDEAALLPVPDPLIDLYLKRMLRHLHAAAVACRAQQLFNVIYRLEEARAAQSEIRWLLERQHVIRSTSGG